VWLAVWTRAVVAPAARRALGLWAGMLMAAAVIFGGTGMHARDLTGLALGDPGVGAVLALTWLLVFVPVARGLVRAEAASYLRSLPSPSVAPHAIAAVALLALQLPWLALWVLGDGARGLVLVGALTIPIALLAAWRPRPGRRIGARWASGPAALRGVFARALRRRAADALLRGAGLAILAGTLAGLLVHNNELVGTAAATLGTAAIAIVLVPAQVGVRLVLLDAYRQTAWLAATTGISDGARVAALGGAIAGVDGVAAALAVLAAVVVGQLDPATAAWLAIATLGVALGGAIAGTRTLIRAADSPTVATRVVVGAAVAAGIAVLWLGVFGLVGVAGAVATIAILAVRA